MLDSTTNTQTVRISSDDQSIWASGPRSAIEWHEYFPIIGGDRKIITVTDAQIVEGMGKVTIDGERVKWDPEGKYDDLANGEVAQIFVVFTLIDEFGVSVDRSVNIEARGTSAGTGYVIPETGQIATDAFSFAAVEASDILMDGHVFDRITPIEIHWDAMDAIRPAIDVVLSGLYAAYDAASGLYNSAANYLNDVWDNWDQATYEAGLVNTVLLNLADYYAKYALSAAAGTAYNAAKALSDVLDDANVEYNAKLVARAAANTAFSAASTAVDLAEDALNAAKNALASATSAAASLVSYIKDAVPWWLSGAVMTLAEWLGLDDELRAANRAVDNALSAVQRETADLAAANVDFSEAQVALNNANAAVNAAANAVISASADLAEELGGQTLGALQSARDATAAATSAALNAYYEAVQDMWDEGVLYGQYPDAGDLASYNAAVAAAFAEIGLAETAEGAAWLALQAAEFGYETATDAINSTELTIDAEASVQVTAQAGLQIDLVLDAGSVDTDIDYTLDTETTLDSEADTFTINAIATNATTGESVAFETVSPNLQFYAGIAYNVSAEFDLLLDLYGKIAGLVAFDVPSGTSDPFIMNEILQMDGWIDLIDFDSTELGSIDVPIPGWIGDILQIELAFPTVETQGKEADVSADVYTDPSGFSMDELTAAILNFAEAKLDFSPEFRALLIEKGVADDVTSNELGQAFIDALSAILDTIVGEGDTDGDGVVPIFLLDNSDTGVDGLFHINNVADVISEIDIDNVGELGFFYAEGTSDNIVQVTVDIDQLVATAVNVALGNAPDTTINPLDLSIGLSDLFEKTSISEATQAKIEKFIKAEFGFEAADFDVRAGANFSQKFALSVDDMDFRVTFEDGTTGTFSADSGGQIVINNASELVDTNGDGDIDYTMSLTPDATFFNDTQIGLNLGYTLDFIKAKAEFMANLPLDEVFKGFDWSIIGLDKAPELPSVGFDLGLGPILRMDGSLDVLSADIFEDIFAFDAGSATISGSFMQAAEIVDQTLHGESGSETMMGGAGDDTLMSSAGDDMMDGAAGNDTADFSKATGPVELNLLDGLGKGSEGRDALVSIENLIGSDHSDVLVGNAGDNRIEGGADNDVIRGKGGTDILIGGNGEDKIFGDDGMETVFGGGSADLIKTGAGHDTAFGGSGADVMRMGKGADTAEGGSGADRMYGNRGNDTMYGDGGNDRLYGGVNRDTLFGGDGNDALRGEAGEDMLVGEAGDDNLYGGTEADVFVFLDDGMNGSDRIKDWEDGLDQIDLSDFGLTSFAEAQAMASNAGSANMKLDFGDGNQVVIENFRFENFDQNDVLLFA